MYPVLLNTLVLAIVDKVKKDPFQQLTEASKDTIMYLGKSRYELLR